MPQDGYGEGHFIAVFEREGGGQPRNEESYGYRGMKEASLTNKQRQSLTPFLEFVRETLSDGGIRKEMSDPGRLFMFGNRLCLMPECGIPALGGLKVLRAGLELGEIKKERFIPSHSLALAMKAEDALRSIDLEADGVEVRKYLNGQSISRENGCIKKDPAPGDTGWTLVTVSGISSGWAKASDKMLKNHYPKGLRSSC